MTSPAEGEYLANFIVAYIGGSIEVIGLLGNMVLWAGLNQRGKQKPMYTILRCMCVTDMAMVMLSFLFQALPAAGNMTSSMFGWVLIVYRSSYYVWPVATATHFIKVWLTVLLSAERWTAVCRPLEFRITGSTTRVRLQILLIVSASAVFVLPKFFEYQCIWHEVEWGRSTNDSQNGSWAPSGPQLCQWEPTSVAESLIFSMLYGVIVYALVAFVLPVGVVLLLNTLIIIELRKSDNLLAELTVMQKYERKISKVPLCVAVVFCILQTPALIINIIHFSGLAKAYPLWNVVLAIGGTLISTNSAVDFFVCFYNVGCPRIVRVKSPMARTKSVAPDRSSRAPTSSDVRLNETTRKSWFIVNSSSAQQLTAHHSVTTTSKIFKAKSDIVALL